VSGKRIYSLPDTVVMDYHASELAVVATWLSFRTGKVKEATQGGINAALSTDAITFIVDMTCNPGFLSTADANAQRELSRDLACKKRFKAYLVVVGQTPQNALTKLGIREETRVSPNAGSHQEMASLADALDFAQGIADSPLGAPGVVAAPRPRPSGHGPAAPIPKPVLQHWTAIFR
jgi:hypothetical protein